MNNLAIEYLNSFTNQVLGELETSQNGLTQAVSELKEASEHLSQTADELEKI